jgi:hypothetical protein
MPSIALTPAGLLNAKRAAAATFNGYKSSHLTEAIACACGYETHAAALAAAAKTPPDDPDFVLLDDEAFARRLAELAGESFPADYDGTWLEYLQWPTPALMIPTLSTKAHDLDYKTVRAKAWRNMMVAAINVGIARRLFTAKPGDNRWPGAKNGDLSSAVYTFNIAGIPAIGYVADAGFDELTIHCALWPTGNAQDSIRAGNAGFSAGEAFAQGWLERRNGAWLQFSGTKPLLACRRQRMQAVASIEVRPSCYADRGNFIM